MDGAKNRVEDKIIKMAKKRLKIKRGFKIHRNIYVVTMVCLILMLSVIGLVEGDFFEAFTAAIMTALAWGIGVGIHFVVSMSQLKELDGNELDKEIEYLKGRAGINSLEEQKNNDVFKMNMDRIKNEKSIENKERH